MKNKKKILCYLVFSLLLLGVFSPLMSNTIQVEAQTGLIYGFVYDAFSLEPMSSASVELHDELLTVLIDSTSTGHNGYFEFWGLDVGTYFLAIYAFGYESNSTYVTIDFEGEEEGFMFYVEPQKGSLIDVWVYDPIYHNYIIGAPVDLYYYRSDSWVYLSTDTTDSSGFCRFSDLAKGNYRVNVDGAPFFENAEDFATLPTHFSGESLLIYLDPIYIPGDGFIEVHVYNNQTWSPIADAKVELFNENYYWIAEGYTNIDGFYNFTGLGPGNYYLEPSADGYGAFGGFVTIDYDGEAETTDLFLEPLLIVHALNILSPSDSQTVEGGLVLVNCDANDLLNLDYLDVYVNGLLITTFNVFLEGYHPEFFVPVFLNGTNTIFIEAFWLDMSSANDSVDVNSVNVIPSVKIKEGDIMNYRAESLTDTQEGDYNYTFTNWLSPFEMNTTFVFHSYDHVGTIGFMEFSIVVNVLNGYVSEDPSGMFTNLHFFPFVSLLPNPQIGDKTIMLSWFEILTVNGTDTFHYMGGYTDVWSLDYIELNSILHVEQDSNVLYHLYSPGQTILTLLETSIDFIDPMVSDEVDFDYNEGETDNSISWNGMDMNAYNYSIYLDSVLLVDSMRWVSGSPIIVDVDGLSAETYVYLIIVSDFAGNTASDIVILTVNLVISEYGSLFGHLILFTTICITLVTVFKKRKFQEIKNI